MSKTFPILFVLVAAGCTGPRAAVTPPPSHSGLDAVLWVQTAAEYEAAALQAFRQAEMMLDPALADTTWTASLEQAEAGAFGHLAAAVVLDVDETVLDNSAYQARLVLEGGTFSPETWRSWVEEASATPVPGALSFTRSAAERGVAVIYLTNRREDEEPATRRNLEALGFPLDQGFDVIISRGERAGWEASDKTPRRQAVAADFRILLLVGDNLGDFAPGEGSLAHRSAIVRDYAAFWGTRWIMLPNPQYGSWEGALYDFDYSLSPAEVRSRKLERLEPARR